MSAGTPTPLADLLQRVGRGDEPAMEDLLQQTRNLLAYSIRGIVKDPWHGEEVLQDVYTYIWLHAAEYRCDRGTPSAWLCMLARSRALDRFRLTRRERLGVELNDEVRPVTAAGSSREPIDAWQRLLLRTSLSELAADHRRLIRMAYFDGFSHTEIAERTGMPLGTVKTKIRTALSLLRERTQETKLPRAS